MKVRLVKCSTVLIQSGFLSKPINILRAYLLCSRIEADLSDVRLCSTKYLEWSSNGKTQVHYLFFEFKNLLMSSINFYFFSSLPFCHPIFPHLCFLSQTEEVIGKGKSEKRNWENTIFSLLLKKVKIKWKVREFFFF